MPHLSLWRAIGLSMVLGVSVSAEAPPDNILSRLEALEAASAAGEHERVVELASAIVKENPDRAEAWFLLGRHAEPLGRNELVISASERAWELGYRYMPWIAVRIARAAASLDQKELALEWIGKALEAGLEDRQRIAGMPAFEKYRDDPVFRSLALLQVEDDSRITGLRSDIDLLVTEAQRLHADPARPAFGRTFLSAAADLKKRVGALSDHQVVWEIRRLAALLGDGHTLAYGTREGSPLEVSNSSLPVKVYLFDEGLYVIDSYDPSADDLVGRRIVAVGSKSPEHLLAASRVIHASDNRMTMMWLGPQFYFTSTDFLRFAGAIGDQDEVDLVVEDADGQRRSVTLVPADFPMVRKLRPSPAIEGEMPLYLENVDANYWMRDLPDDAAVYVQFNQVRDDESESIQRFADRLGGVLSNGKVRNLIIDVRHNNGGNNGLLRPLIRQIVAFDVRAGTTIFVITGRNTFSAAQNFINRVEALTSAVFVGEPSSSRPNFAGEETEVILPWSRIAVSISSRYWQDSDPGDDRAWIAPHIPVTPRASDYFSGRDAALEAILEVCAE